jgi:hypothetical protein
MMSNVTIQVHNGVFNLLDDQGAILFFSEDWDEVDDFAKKNDLNIQYEPKDLVFDVGSDEDYGPFVYFDIKYGTSDGNLGGHNVINLPSFMDSGELMECHFGYDESMSTKQAIDALVAAGATYEQII